jgi:actin related protein 2/3 complex subunit 1A/1B
VFSSYIKDVEEKPTSTNWGSKMPFGNLMAEFACGGGWVHSICFSANGERLAWVGHDSSVSVVDAANGQKLTTMKTDVLPFMAVSWITDNSLVAAGFDCCPMLYAYNGSSVSFVSKLDDSGKQQTAGKVSAMARFKAMDSRAATDDSSTETTLGTVHQNTIIQLSIHSGTKSKCTKFATSGVDGQLVIWDVKSLESAFAGLRIA